MELRMLYRSRCGNGLSAEHTDISEMRRGGIVRPRADAQLFRLSREQLCHVWRGFPEQ